MNNHRERWFRMYKFAICDDNAQFCEQFRVALDNIMSRKEAAYNLNCFYDRESFSKVLHKGGEFDLIFLDIVFGNENGLELAKFLRKKQINTDIVFITGYDEYAVDSYDVEPLHYLLKSGDWNKLETAVERFFTKNSSKKLRIKTTSGTVFLNLEDIVCFEIFSHDIIIHLTNGTKETCHGTLKYIENTLAPMNFVRPHRSYLVNLDCISKITHNCIQLTNGMRVPLSKLKYNKIQINLMEYLGKKNMFK